MTLHLMASSYAPLVRLLLLLSLKAFLAAAATTTVTTDVATTTLRKHHRLVTKLIHRDSVHSPFYNQNLTSLERSKRAVKSSLVRLDHLRSKIEKRMSDDIRAGVIAEETGAQFLANFSVGEPPVAQLVTIDTGSNLLWVQCLPCIKCFEQSVPIFDPSKSSTYTNLSCTSPYCIFSAGDKCDPENQCKYALSYLDQTSTMGNLATEKLTFETSDEGTTPVIGTVFGCGHENDGFNGQLSGVLGLGPENISLVSRLNSKFSYCFGNISDPSYIYNQLILGDGAKIEGDSTSLEIFNGLYYLTLEGLSLGEKRLDIDPEISKRQPSGKGGMVIDTGSTISFLAEGGFDPLSAEVQSLLDGKLDRVDDPYHPSRLCYKGSVGRDLAGFPVATFHFSGGADLALDAHSLFQENGPDEFCMAVFDSGPMGLSVVGIMAQQGYNVAYDLVGSKINFQSIECELLEN